MIAASALERPIPPVWKEGDTHPTVSQILAAANHTIRTGTGGVHAPLIRYMRDHLQAQLDAEAKAYVDGFASAFRLVEDPYGDDVEDEVTC